MKRLHTELVYGTGWYQAHSMSIWNELILLFPIEYKWVAPLLSRWLVSTISQMRNEREITDANEFLQISRSLWQEKSYLVDGGNVEILDVKCGSFVV